MRTVYEPIHFRSSRKAGEGERDEIALLIRSDHKIFGRHSLRMKEPWIGPQHGIKRSPRWYRWAKFRVDTVDIKLLSAHAAFGKAAQDEHNSRLARWICNRAGFAAVLQDANQGIMKTRLHVGRKSASKVTGYKIDQCVYKGGRLIRKEVLPHYGSDHPAMLYVFEVKDRKGRKTQLTLIGWNVKVGRPPTQVRQGLSAMMHKYNPDAFALYETYQLYGHLDNLPIPK